MEEEGTVTADLKAANELLSDATSKLHDARLSATAVNKQSVIKCCLNVAVLFNTYKSYM